MIVLKVVTNSETQHFLIELQPLKAVRVSSVSLFVLCLLLCC